MCLSKQNPLQVLKFIWTALIKDHAKNLIFNWTLQILAIATAEMAYMQLNLSPMINVLIIELLRKRQLTGENISQFQAF